VFPDPEILASRQAVSRPGTGTKRKMKRQDSHVMDLLLEANTEKFGEINVMGLLTPSINGPILGKHPSFNEGGYAPAICLKAEESKAENAAAYYKVKFYDGAEASLAPNELVVLARSQCDRALAVVSKLDQTMIEEDDGKSETTLNSSWNNLEK